MSALTRMFRKRREKDAIADVQEGKLYKIINTCSIIGLFIAVGIIVLMMTKTIELSSTMIGIVGAIAIVCFGCILALPWIRKLEAGEFKVLSIVFLSIVGAVVILWVVCDIVIISSYKSIKDLVVNGDKFTESQTLDLISGLLSSINFLKVAVFLTLQFSVASFVATAITKYRKTMIPFQAIAYASYGIVDFWFSGFIFSVKINSDVKSVNGGDFFDVLGQIFSVNTEFINFLISKVMITILILAIAYVTISNIIIKKQDQRRIQNATEDLAHGKLIQRTNDAEPVQTETAEEKLEKLKTMFEKNLITQEEYEQKRAKILEDM